MFIAITVTGFWFYFWGTGPKEEGRDLMRYVRAVTNSVNPEELQSWAVSVLNEASKATNTGWRADLTSSAIVRRIPTVGNTPAPAFVSGSRNQNDHTGFVRLIYLQTEIGGGNWWMDIGDSLYKREGNCYEWIPGVYICINPSQEDAVSGGENDRAKPDRTQQGF